MSTHISRKNESWRLTPSVSPKPAHVAYINFLAGSCYPSKTIVSQYGHLSLVVTINHHQNEVCCQNQSFPWNCLGFSWKTIVQIISHHLSTWKKYHHDTQHGFQNPGPSKHNDRRSWCHRPNVPSCHCEASTNSGFSCCRSVFCRDATGKVKVAFWGSSLKTWRDVIIKLYIIWHFYCHRPHTQSMIVLAGSPNTHTSVQQMVPYSPI